MEVGFNRFEVYALNSTVSPASGDDTVAWEAHEEQVAALAEAVVPGSDADAEGYGTTLLTTKPLVESRTEEISLALPYGLVADDYLVVFGVLAVDGHVSSGQFVFSYQSAQ